MQQGAEKILKNFRLSKTEDRWFARKQLSKVWKIMFEIRFDLKFHNFELFLYISRVCFSCKIYLEIFFLSAMDYD